MLFSSGGKKKIVFKLRKLTENNGSFKPNSIPVIQNKPPLRI